MTRDEEIKIAADKYCKDEWTHLGFVAGAEWAEEHPHWISVEDELPKESGGFYLSVDSDGEIWFRQFTKLYGWRSTIGNMLISGIEVTHWMPLPAAPKKGGEK